MESRTVSVVPHDLSLVHTPLGSVKRVFASQLGNQKQSSQLTYLNLDLEEHFLEPSGPGHSISVDLWGSVIIRK